MPTQAYALFATPIGHCGIAWSERGLTGVQLPEQDEAATRARMGRRFAQCSEGMAPPPVQEAISAVRAVGQALGVNPFAPVVPCHRVLAADGCAGGFSANGGVTTKLRLLQIERARFNGPGLFDDQTGLLPENGEAVLGDVMQTTGRNSASPTVPPRSPPGAPDRPDD